MEYGKSNGRWADGKTTLEAKLGAIGARVEEVFALLAADRDRREKEAELARAAERQRTRDLEHQRHQEVLATDLQNMAAQWEQAKPIRTFLDAAEPSLAALNGDHDGRQAWIAWARTYADSIDPTRNAAQIAKVLTPKAVPSPYQWPRPL